MEKKQSEIMQRLRNKLSPLDMALIEELFDNLDRESPPVTADIEEAAKAEVGLEDIEHASQTDYSFIEGAKFGVEWQKRQIALVTGTAEEITIEKFIELNRHQPFELWPDLAEVIQHAACNWKTDGEWTNLLEQINKVCLQAYPSQFTQSTTKTVSPIGEWQLCPKCNGTGENYINELLGGNMTSGRVGHFPCDVCNGAKILSSPASQSTTIERLTKALEEIKGASDSERLSTTREYITALDLINYIAVTSLEALNYIKK